MKEQKHHKQFEGKEINGYRIVKAIGQGKFSTVYWGENSQGLSVAVKEIKIFDMMDPKQRQKCLKQVELMKPLQHPNIIQYIDNFTYNNELIIITQWAEKGDLKKLIKNHIEEEIPFQEIKIWDYIIQISSALKHMHEKKIMHRDLKPANIFISQDNSLKVGDLGLGRAFTSETLEAHSKVGTPLYMAPQLLTEEGYHLNADVWSLGCIAYQLLQLRSPFRNENQKMSLMDLFNNITRGEYKPVSKRYSPQLADLINRMIVINPTKRLSSSQVLQIASENFDRSNKNPRIDCIITMDDISNKLNLVDYSGFCRLSENKPINKFYFAFEDKAPNNSQLFLFLQICYWLMNLSKPDRSRDKCVTQAKTMIDWSAPEDACNKFLKDIQSFGIKTEIDFKIIAQGYGQGVCYLLNQLLNRELIRVNFKFMPAEQVVVQNQEDAVQMADVDQEQKLVRHSQDEFQQDIEETHDFERSLVFKRGRKKIGVGNTKLLEKIREIEEEDINIIHSKVNPKDWEIELVRVDKKLSDINQGLKENRKKSAFENFERVKNVSTRITQYVKLLRPSCYRLYSSIESDLNSIKQGEKKVNSVSESFKGDYSQQTLEKNILTDQLSRLTSNAREHIPQLQEIQSRLDELGLLSTNMVSNSSENSLVKLRASISHLKKDIRTADVTIGLLEWQVRQFAKEDMQKEKNVVQQF